MTPGRSHARGAHGHKTFVPCPAKVVHLAAMNGDTRCAGKVVLVTGAQRGIGREVAIRFGRAGADVALNFLDDEAGAKSAASEITGLGRRAVTLAADIAKPDNARRLVAEAERALGPIDV